jgi:hypothetical protein
VQTISSQTYATNPLRSGYTVPQIRDQMNLSRGAARTLMAISLDFCTWRKNPKAERAAKYSVDSGRCNPNHYQSNVLRFEIFPFRQSSKTMEGERLKMDSTTLADLLNSKSVRAEDLEEVQNPQNRSISPQGRNVAEDIRVSTAEAIGFGDTSTEPGRTRWSKAPIEIDMATAARVCEDELDGLTSENFSEVEPDEPETEKQVEDFPEGAKFPDEETVNLIACVIKLADDFKPAHTKLKNIIEANRVKILLLKDKFGVRKGWAGHHLLVGRSGKKTPMLWADFVLFYFDVTPKRINQLLDVEDEKERSLTIKFRDDEKPLFKKGYAAAMEEANKRLELLQPTAAAVNMAEQIVQQNEHINFLSHQNDELAATAGGFEQYVHELEGRLSGPRPDSPHEAPSEPGHGRSSPAACSSEVIAYFSQYSGQPAAFAEELSLLVRHYGLARKITIKLI